MCHNRCGQTGARWHKNQYPMINTPISPERQGRHLNQFLWKWTALFVTIVGVAIGGRVRAETECYFVVGAREVMATRTQCDALGLNAFVDGNLGVVKDGGQFKMYGPNGSQPFWIKGTRKNPFQKVEPGTISTRAKNFGYISGGPIFHDPASGRLLLFYHAEIHRGTAKNFYTVLGLAIQTDDAGLVFKDIGPIFVPNIPNEQATHSIEVCGAPYVIRDGYFYVYGRDAAILDGKPQQSNLSAVRAKVRDVVENALRGKSAVWKKYYQGRFCEPARGGKSTPLEDGNPETRWMDISYNVALKKFVMIVAANTTPWKVGLFVSFSDDGLHWTQRKQLAHEDGESFYPSIIGWREDSRQTGNEFFVYYTSSKKGGWERWSDAEIVRRKIIVQSTP